MVDVGQETNHWISDHLKVKISDDLDEIMDDLGLFDIIIDLGGLILDGIIDMELQNDETS